jgi:hypothetical protein
MMDIFGLWYFMIFGCRIMILLRKQSIPFFRYYCNVYKFWDLVWLVKTKFAEKTQLVKSYFKGLLNIITLAPLLHRSGYNWITAKYANCLQMHKYLDPSSAQGQ